MPRPPVTSFEFARAFGDALANFLTQERISQNQAAKLLGIGRAKLNTYCHDSPKGIRRKPDAEFLYQVCAKLGFEFQYDGFKVSASNLNGHPAEQIRSATEQLLLGYERQFNLTNGSGTVAVSFKRPPGRVEVSVSLKAASAK